MIATFSVAKFTRSGNSNFLLAVARSLSARKVAAQRFGVDVPLYDPVVLEIENVIVAQIGKPAARGSEPLVVLSELPEFQPQVLDSLRQPLEIGEVAIARANHRVTYPARFMLVAAMNPCRCGRASEPGFACKRGANARCAAEYQGRLSGPLIDRIDLHIEVPAVTAADLILPPPAEGSREVAARVARARAMQAERYAAVGLPQVRTNAAAHGPLLEEVARPDAGGLALLRDAADAMRLSARGYHRVLRVARTLADLDGADKVGRVHLAEALSYRALTDEVRRAA